MLLIDEREERRWIKQHQRVLDNAKEIVLLLLKEHGPLRACVLSSMVQNELARRGFPSSWSFGGRHGYYDARAVRALYDYKYIAQYEAEHEIFYRIVY